MRVTTPQQNYLNEVFGLPDPELRKVRTDMTEVQKDFMSIDSSEARLLQFLIRGFGLKKIVEFGTLFGYSALAMAKALPPDGFVITLEKDEQHYRQALATFKTSGEAKKIEALCGEANELMGEIEPRGPFDMIFIDANKTAYVTYLDWAEKNLRSGGLIVGDNTFLWGALWGECRHANVGENQQRVMKEFNLRLADPKKYNSTLIPTVEGLTVAQKL